MTDWPSAVIDWTPETLLALVFLFVITDRLVAGGRLLKEEAKAERWRETYENERQARIEEAAQSKALADATRELASEHAKLTVAILQSIRDKADS